MKLFKMNKCQQMFTTNNLQRHNGLIILTRAQKSRLPRYVNQLNV